MATIATRPLYLIEQSLKSSRSNHLIGIEFSRYVSPERAVAELKAKQTRYPKPFIAIAILGIGLVGVALMHIPVIGAAGFIGLWTTTEILKNLAVSVGFVALSIFGFFIQKYDNEKEVTKFEYDSFQKEIKEDEHKLVQFIFKRLLVPKFEEVKYEPVTYWGSPSEAVVVKQYQASINNAQDVIQGVRGFAYKYATVKGNPAIYNLSFKVATRWGEIADDLENHLPPSAPKRDHLFMRNPKFGKPIFNSVKLCFEYFQFYFTNYEGDRSIIPFSSLTEMLKVEPIEFHLKEIHLNQERIQKIYSDAKSLIKL